MPDWAKNRAQQASIRSISASRAAIASRSKRSRGRARSAGGAWQVQAPVWSARSHETAWRTLSRLEIDIHCSRGKTSPADRVAGRRAATRARGSRVSRRTRRSASSCARTAPRGTRGRRRRRSARAAGAQCVDEELVRLACESRVRQRLAEERAARAGRRADEVGATRPSLPPKSASSPRPCAGEVRQGRPRLGLRDEPPQRALEAAEVEASPTRRLSAPILARSSGDSTSRRRRRRPWRARTRGTRSARLHEFRQVPFRLCYDGEAGREHLEHADAPHLFRQLGDMEPDVGPREKSGDVARRDRADEPDARAEATLLQLFGSSS